MISPVIFKKKFRPLHCIAFLAALHLSPATFAVTVIQDDFDNGTVNTGASILPNGTWASSANTGESGGFLTLTTAPIGSALAAPNQWSGAVIYSTVASPNLNIFNQTVSVSIREFSMTGTGDHAAPNSRFRIGLMPRDQENYASGAEVKGANSFGQFYNNGNDGISVNFGLDTSGNTTFDVRYKHNVTSATDPNLAPPGFFGVTTVASGFVATGFDFNVSATSWQLVFYNSVSGATYTRGGAWDLTSFASDWGNASDGWGNAAFIMGVQNMGGMALSAPTDAFNGSTTATIGSLLVTSVPEPSRAILVLASLTCLFLRRKRQA